FNSSSTIASGSIVKYAWTFGDTDNDTLKNTRHNYLTEDTFISRLIVVSDQNCADTISQQVVVHPQAKAAFLVNNNVQCFKQQKFVLTNQSAIKRGLLSYNWSFGDGSFSTDTNFTKTYLKDSTYTIRLIASSEQNCRDTAISSVVLNVSPDAIFTIAKDKQCFRGNSFNFTNQSSVKKGAIVAYEWKMGDGNTRSSNGVSNYIYASEDTFNVKLIARTDKNCFDTLLKPAITFAQPNVKFIIPNDSQCWQKNFFNFNNQTKLKYGTLSNSWDFGDNTFSNQFAPSTKKYANKSAAYIIRYKAVSEHGCSDSAQHRIVLLERPVSNFDINDSIQCFRGHLFSFNNTTSFSAMNTLSYWWNYDNGDTSIGKLPKTAVYSQPDIYNVRLISYSSLTNCYDTLFKNVIPAPHASVKYTVNNDSQCFRYNKFIFTNSSNVQFGSNTYRWSFGDNTSDTSKNPVKKYTVQGAYTVKLVATTNYDCVDSTSSIIGFYATPKALFSIDDSLQCLNKQAFNFIDRTTLSKGTYQPSWWFGDNTTANGSVVNNKTFSTSEYHQVRLSVITDKACVDTLVQRVYLENIKNSRIVLSDKDSQCWKGNAFNFVNLKINSRVNYVSAKWIYGDGQESKLNAPGTQKYNKDGEFTMLLCTESDLGCFDTIRKLIVVHPHPVTAFNAAAVCYPEPVVFNNTSGIKKGSIDEFIWDFGDNKQAFVASPTHLYPASGLYNVRLQTVSNYGCRDTLVVNGAANVQEKPKAFFDFDQLSTIERDQTRLQFNNKSSANATRYYWDFGNATNSTIQNPIGLFQDTGRWIVTLVSFTSEGCSDTFKLSTGAILPDFTYYLPNAFSPNGDVHNNVYRGEGSVFAYKFKMEIFNRWGEKLWESTDINQGWDGYYQGELCMQDVYVCRVQIVPFKGTLKTFEQSFYLLR
ncbi:MAG: PKD domain-containing protein, partial [Chitinophagaceae bacterium]